MKRLQKMFVKSFVGILATIGLIAVVNEIRNPRPWWIVRRPAIADSEALLADCAGLLAKYGTNVYAQLNGGASLIVDRPPAVGALNPASVDVVLGQGVIIRLHPGKGPSYGYIVVPSLKDAVDPKLPCGLAYNGRYILRTEQNGIYTFKDTWR